MSQNSSKSKKNQDTPVSDLPLPKTSIIKSKQKYVGIIVGALILIILLSTLLVQTISKARANKVIAQVGEEKIYQKDLDTELKLYPPQKNIDREKLLLDKLVKDSIILQQAQKEKLITVDPKTIDSVQKDYAKRLETVKGVEEKVQQRALRVTGKIISIWFHNVFPAPIGDEKAKEISFAKITQLHQDVVSKKITIDQAGELIKQDSSLAQVDPVYYNNAIFDFSVDNIDHITFDKTFNEALVSLNPGEVSDVFLIKDKDPQTRKMIDAVYMFGQLDSKTNLDNTVGYDQWYKNHEKEYPVTYY